MGYAFKRTPMKNKTKNVIQKPYKTFKERCLSDFYRLFISKNMYIPVQVAYKSNEIKSNMTQKPKGTNLVAEAFKCNAFTIQGLKMKVSKSHKMKDQKSLKIKKLLLNLVGMQRMQFLISNHLRQSLLTWESSKFYTK